MNARDKIKPKSIRLAILLALSDGAITTIDDLQTTIDEPRKRVAGAVYPAVVDGLITRIRDDVTNGPAYKITASGKMYLVQYSGAVDETELTASPSREEAQTAIVTPGVKTDSPDRHEPTASAIIGAMAFGYQGKNVPPEGHWLTEFYQFGVADRQKNAEISNLRSRFDHITLMLINSSAEALAFEGPIELLLANILHKAAHKNTPVGYVIQRAGKPLVRITKAEKAEAQALAFARGGKRANVFALVPAGAAVPGAEWVAA